MSFLRGTPKISFGRINSPTFGSSNDDEEPFGSDIRSNLYTGRFRIELNPTAGMVDQFLMRVLIFIKSPGDRIIGASPKIDPSTPVTVSSIGEQKVRLGKIRDIIQTLKPEKISRKRSVF